MTLKVKYADHRRLSRRTTLDRATADGQLVGQMAAELLQQVPDIERRGVRLTGVALSSFEATAAPRQLLLGEHLTVGGGTSRGEALGAALDKIHEKFGSAAITRAVHLPRRDA